MDSGAFTHSHLGRSPLFPAHGTNTGPGMNYFGNSMPTDDTLPGPLNTDSLDENLGGGLETSLDFGFPLNTIDEHHKFDVPDNNRSRDPTSSLYPPKQSTRWANSMEAHVRELRHHVRQLSRVQNQPRTELDLVRSQLTMLQSQQSTFNERQSEVQTQYDTLRHNCENLQDRYDQAIVQLQAIQPTRERLESFQNQVASVLAYQNDSKNQESFLLSCFTRLDQAIRTLEVQQSELSRRVDAYESETADTAERLQEFFERVAGGLDSIVRFLHQKFPSAPPFREVEALINLEGEDEQQL